MPCYNCIYLFFFQTNHIIRDMSSGKTIGQRIQNAREFRKLDRTSFAKAIGVKYRDILRWETTTHEPRAATLKKMADALNINVNYFLDEEAEYLSLINYLPEEELMTITDLGDILFTKRNQMKACIEKENDFIALQTISRLMMDYVDPKLLIYLIEVIREYTAYTGEIPEQLVTADERRLFIKDMILYINDFNLLKSTAKVLVAFTRNEDVSTQLGMLMTLTDSFPKPIPPGKK